LILTVQDFFFKRRFVGPRLRPVWISFGRSFIHGACRFWAL